MPQHRAHHPTKADHNAAFLQIVPSKKQLKISTFDSSNAHNGLPPNHDFSRSQTCIVDYGPSISTFGPIFQQFFCGNGKQAILYCLKVSVNYRGFCVLLIILQFYTTMVFITLILYSLYYILSSDTDVIDRDFVQSNIPWINSCCVNACWCLISIFLKFELNPVLKQMSKNWMPKESCVTLYSYVAAQT